MIAEVKPDGMILLESQSITEKNILQQLVKNLAVDSAGFMDCCGRKQCAFELKLKE